MSRHPMTADQLINKAFWLLVIGIASWGVTRIDRMTDSIEALNNRMAVVLTKMAVHDRDIQTLFEAEFDNNRAHKREHKEN